jgi:ferredoxin
VKLRVNMIACAGHGVCAELLPELITLDPWGYPLLADTPVPDGLADHAKRAVAACPTLALLAEESVVGLPGVRRRGRHSGRA